jgi:hypothetical protein
MDVLVPTIPGDDGETDRLVLWAGALLHAPHRAVRQQAKFLHSLVYISGSELFLYLLTVSAKSRVPCLSIWTHEYHVYYSS